MTFCFENLVLYFGKFIQLNCGNLHKLNTKDNSNNEFLLGQEITLAEIQLELENDNNITKQNISEIIDVLKQNQLNSLKTNIFEFIQKESSQNVIINVVTFYVIKDQTKLKINLKTYHDNFNVLVKIGNSIEDSSFSCKNYMSNTYAYPKNYIIECILNYVHNNRSSFDELTYNQLFR